MNPCVLKLVTAGSTHSECHYVLQAYIHQYKNMFVSFHTNVLLVHWKVFLHRNDTPRLVHDFILVHAVRVNDPLETLCNKHCLEAEEICYLSGLQPDGRRGAPCLNRPTQQDVGC